MSLIIIIISANKYDIVISYLVILNACVLSVL